MNYIVPKYLMENLEITESEKIFKIEYKTDINLSVRLFNIIIPLDINRIISKYGEYIIYLNNIEEIIKYDQFLDNKIKNYKKIVTDNEFISCKYKIKNLTNNYLIIKYVQKTGFLNIPIISIYNG
jgi:hypothetical protein